MHDPSALRLLAHRLARRWRIPGYDRDDLEQEALVAMLSAPPDSAEPVLADLARRHLFGLLKRSRRREQLAPISPLTSDPAHDDLEPWEALVAAEEIDRLLAGLPESEALVLELDRRGLTTEEIAGALVISEHAVCSRRYRAVEALRRLQDPPVRNVPAPACARAA